MSDTQERQGNDGAVPSVARVYDWLLGGTSNYQVDRNLGEMMVGLAPELPDAARARCSATWRSSRPTASARRSPG
jgi:hypothetical protein